jgi:hypothetical protein
MRDRLVVVGASLSLVITASLLLRILVIDKPGVIVILLPAAVGAVLALLKPRQPAVIAVACLLTALTAVASLIGGEGPLYVPSIVLLTVAVFRLAFGRRAPSRTNKRSKRAGLRRSGTQGGNLQETTLWLSEDRAAERARRTLPQSAARTRVERRQSARG